MRLRAAARLCYVYNTQAKDERIALLETENAILHLGTAQVKFFCCCLFQTSINGCIILTLFTFVYAAATFCQKAVSCETFQC